MKKILTALAVAFVLGARAQLVEMPASAAFTSYNGPGIPAQTTNGVIVVSGQTGSHQGGAFLFNGIVGEEPPGEADKWCVPVLQGGPSIAWVVYQFANDDQWAVTNYVFWLAEDTPERDPRVWQLEGTNDLLGKNATDDYASANWTVVDYREYSAAGGRLGERCTRHSFSCEDNFTAYNAYRLNIMDNYFLGDRQHFQLSLWEMRGHSGVEPENILVVEGAPAGVGEVEPPFGKRIGITSGTLLAASATPVWTNGAENVIAVPTRWETFYWNGAKEEYVSTGFGNTPSFTYEHPQDAAGRIVWTFAISNLFDVTSGPGGSVSGGGWRGSGETVILTANPDPGHQFEKWTGDVPPNMRHSPQLVLPGSAPCVLEAEFIAEGAAGSTRFVAMEKDGGDNGNNGLSWASPMLTIQTALDDLPNGGLVLVGEGQYPIWSEIALEKPVEIRGATGNPWDVEVLRGGEGSTRIFRLNHADALVRFIRISNGWTGDAVGGFQGGNVNIHGAGGTVADCVLVSGMAAGWGGRGGNLAMTSNEGRVLRCALLFGGYEGGPGNAGQIAMTAGRVEQSWIHGGWHPNNGTGAAIQLMGGALLNCTITRNDCFESAAIAATGGVVANCVIVDNRSGLNPDSNGGSVFAGAWQAGFFQNCVTDSPILLNNGCFTAEDGFGFVDAANNNYRLTAASFARGKGYHIPSRIAQTDFDGVPLPASGPVDAGCWQYPDTGAFAFDFYTPEPRHAVPHEFVFHVEAVNANGPVEYVWDFGDGNTLSFTTNAASFTVSHLYTTFGAHTVSVTGTVDHVNFVVRELAGGVFGAPDIIHVRAGEQEPAFPHDTWDNALRHVLDAIPLAADGTLILVSNGWYEVNTALVLDKAVTLRGVGERPDHVEFQRTDGNNYVVLLDHPGARCENVAVRNARSEQKFGGNVSLSPRGGTLANCHVTGGFVSSWGQGDGGGVYIRGDRALVTHCIIMGNSTGEDMDYRGSGVRMTAGRLEHSIIIGNNSNSARLMAAGVFASGGVVANCTIVLNRGLSYGGIIATGGARVVNTVIAENISVENGGDAAAWGGDGDCFVNCFSDTAAAIPGPGNNKNFSAGEMLANVKGSNFSPAPGSPLIDASVDLSPFIPGYVMPEKDLFGNDRRMGDEVDVGCVEFDPEQLAVSFSSDIIVSLLPSGTPLEVTFTASVSGTNGNENLWYVWDFDEDMDDVGTDNPVLPQTFLTGGWFTVTLTVTNLNEDAAATVVTKSQCLRLVPPVLHVDLNSVAVKPTRGFDTWDNAAQDVQSAVNFALDGCEIVIRAGHYEVSNHYYPPGAALGITKPVRVRSEFNDPSTVRIGPRNHGNNRGHMALALYISNKDAFVSGVTLADGWGDGNSGNQGKGVNFGQYGGTVSNCVLRGHAIHSEGGAADLNSADALLTHCVITGNWVCGESNEGYSLVRVGFAGGRVENCLVFGNENSDEPHQNVFVPMDRKNVIAYMRGGELRNCTIAANEGFRYGVFWFRDNWGPPPAMAVHCVAAGNGEIPLYRDHDRVFESTVDLAFNHNCLFGTPEKIFKDFAGGNFRLSSSSPAVNAGPRVDPATYPAFDLDGRPRVQGGKLDHGCYEANPPGTLLLVR